VRLTLFVRQLGAGFGNLGAQFSQHSFGPPSQAEVLTSNARRPRAKLRQYKASHLVNHGFVRITLHQLTLLLLNPEAQQCRLRRSMFGISRSTRRLLPLTPQVSQAGNPAVKDRRS
jgi:hypothetical protein